MSRERAIGAIVGGVTLVGVVAAGTTWEHLRDGRQYVGAQIEPQNNIYALTYTRCDPNVPGTKIFEREMFFRDVFGDPRLRSTLIVHRENDPKC
jgi:hypothetical protein